MHSTAKYVEYAVIYTDDMLVDSESTAKNLMDMFFQTFGLENTESQTGIITQMKNVRERIENLLTPSTD